VTTTAISAVGDRVQHIRFNALTSLRFAAAAWVVLYHTAPASLTGDRNASIGGNLVGIGYTGVGIFFVLSGFILALVYGRITSWPAAKAFLIARFARIYPAYLMSLLIDLPRLFLWRIEKYGDVFGVTLALVTLSLQALILPAFHPSVPALNGPTWSIAVEVAWYLTYPLTAACLLRVQRTSTIWFLLAAFWAIAIAVPMGLEQTWGRLDTVAEAQVKYGALPRFPEFAVGLLLCKLYHKGPPGRSAWGPAFALLVGAVSMGAIVFVALNRQHIPYLVVHNGLLIPAYAGLIWALANCDGAVSAILAHPALVLLGEASYSIYLLHMPLFYWVAPAQAEIELATYAVYLCGPPGNVLCDRAAVPDLDRWPVERGL